MHLKLLAWKKRAPSVPAALALMVGQCWAQTPPEAAPLSTLSTLPSEVSRDSQGIQLTEPQPAATNASAAVPVEIPAAASSALPVDAGANAQVLQTWQQQTGQAVWVNDQGQVEFHGAVTVDAYHNSTAIPSGNPLLSPLPPGSFGKITFQGDVRSTSPENDVTYLQGVVTHGNDRSLMPRYDTQINSLQAGRAGPGYQIAVGDVVAGFSGLSSNLGLRGLLAARQTDALTLTGFAGTVAESWESLLNLNTLDGFPARTRYSRDVYGGKAELRYSEATSGFVTLQGWRDRTSSADLLPGSPAWSGTVASVGGRYLTPKGQLTAEMAHSSQQNVSTAVAGVPAVNADGSGNALTVDTSYRWNTLGLRGGYHDLSTGFVSLAQTVAPGVREWYGGGDWMITPQLTWSTDVRHALSRVAENIFFPASSNEMDSLTNRLTFNVASLPGLMLSLSDTRNKGKDSVGNKTTNNQTQYNAAYAFGAWNTQLGLGTGESRSQATPQFDSESRQWQLGLGRSFMGEAGSDGMPGWNLSTQLFSSGQNQRLVSTGTEVRSLVLGLSASLQSQHYGTLSAGWQRQRMTQPLAAMPTLITQSLNLDWALALSRQWTIKTYVRINHRNHGDVLLWADERIVGVQGSYQW